MQTPILDALIEMMETVASNQLPLHMPNLYRGVLAFDIYNEKSDLDIHNCGTACCVMGYAALDKNVRTVAGIKMKTGDPAGYQAMAVNVWEKLENEITEELADSIAGSYAEERLTKAKEGLEDLGLPTNWLADYYHVSANVNNDDPAEAVLYMKALRERLQKVQL